MNFVMERVENNGGYQHFLLFPQCFQKASLSGSLKVGIVWLRVKQVIFFSPCLNPLALSLASVSVKMGEIQLYVSIYKTPSILSPPNHQPFEIVVFESLLITKRQILDSSKLNEFADNNLKLDVNGRKLSKQVENTAGKRRNCLLRAISPFPTVFSKGLYPRGVKRCHCVGMG